MFREVRRTERVNEEERRKLEDERRRRELYRNIKPETGITFEECKEFWNNIFS